MIKQVEQEQPHKLESCLVKFTRLELMSHAELSVIRQYQQFDELDQEIAPVS
jgi:hypothetical protein